MGSHIYRPSEVNRQLDFSYCLLWYVAELLALSDVNYGRASVAFHATPEIAWSSTFSKIIRCLTDL